MQSTKYCKSTKLIAPISGISRNHFGEGGDTHKL